jgi:(S)-mandelate dehydrogenase
MRIFHSVDAMRARACRYLPALAFDFIDGGAGREYCVRRNISSLEAVTLWPRVLRGHQQRNQHTQFLGRVYSSPFGVAPIGLANLVRPGTDLALARAAANAGIGYALSTAATSALESISPVCPGAWFQLYVGADPAITEDLLSRAQACGVEVLIVTVDVPVPGRRERDLNNGFRLPLKTSLRLVTDIAGHPCWALRALVGGAPRFSNLERYTAASASTRSLAELMARQSSDHLNWDGLMEIRARWQRKLIVKGILRPDDAARAVNLGADAIAVSNHGGRQFDAAPAAIDALIEIRRAIGRAVPLVFDGGIRSGEDIARAIALGADFVLLGRPFLYAVASMGVTAGPRVLIAQLIDELDRSLALLGCATLAELESTSSPGSLGTKAAND